MFGGEEAQCEGVLLPLHGISKSKYAVCKERESTANSKFSTRGISKCSGTALINVDVMDLC